MTINFIYFDLGRVLLDFTHERGFEQIAAASGLTAQAVNDAMMKSGLSDRYETGELTSEEFHKAFCETTGSHISLDDLMTAWGDIFDLMPATVALAANLRSAGNRIGILSNTCAAHWEFAARKFRVLDQIFDPVVTSYEAKSMKPDAGIYQAAAQAAACDPGNLFFVDDREENVEGARKLGWHAVLFQSARQLSHDLEALGVEFNR